ncbi:MULTISPECIES: hypothetical protein [unclassified Microbacterium]|uniref:hypothetical protein n=1 Tax=unclassified Microbacterium TaxID=2609290 RepID=UPI00300FD2ED
MNTLATLPENRTTITPTAAGFGFWTAIATAALTVITFALAITALPNKVEYPFTSDEIVAQWPGDYYWMFPAMLLMVLFVALVAAVHELAAAGRAVFSRLAFGLAVIASAVLLIDYYVQAAVMQLNLEKGQLDGWSILTQYNPNGVFIALEELGYIVMSLVFLCLAPVFAERTGLDRGIRWLFLGSFAATVISFVLVSVGMGMDRGDVFEIIVISIVWLTLVAAGPLLAIRFHRAQRLATATPAAGD